MRLGRTLAMMGRVAEAQPWYEKAIKLAPGRRDLRLALIGQLAQDQKYAEAAAQYEALDQAEPEQPRHARATGAPWCCATPNRPAGRAQGRRGGDLAEAARGQAERPGDRPRRSPTCSARPSWSTRPWPSTARPSSRRRATPSIASTSANTCTSSSGPPRRWPRGRKIAEGPNRNAKNLGRLAEVLAGFGYVKEAIAPADGGGRARQGRLRPAAEARRAARTDWSGSTTPRSSSPRRRSWPSKDEEKTAVLEARVKNDQAAGRLAARIEALRKELEGDRGKTAERLVAAGPLPRGRRQAPRGGPRRRPRHRRSSRARSRPGRWPPGSASRPATWATPPTPSAGWPRSTAATATEYLTGIAKLESRLGRVDAALKAGRDLLAAAPGNPEHYEFFAQLCFQLGRSEEGLDALRRAVRVNPNDTKIILTLAETLAGKFRTDEAIEMYWRAFDKAEDLDAKLGIVSRLTELYLQRNQFDRLLTRLQHQDRDARPDAGQSQQRDVAICLAQAYASSGDLGIARAELEPLLAANARDTQLLQQLSKLAEEEGDLEGAAQYQKQLNELAPSDEGTARLAQLYARYGELEEAQAVWSKMAADKGESPHRILQAIDSLLGSKKPQPVLEITESMVRKDPRDWEALYRQGVALADLGKTEEAARAFRALLALRLADDEKSAIVKARTPRPQAPEPGRPAVVDQPQGHVPLEDRLGAVLEIRTASRLEAGLLLRHEQPGHGLGAAGLRPGADGRPGLAGRAWPSGRVPARARKLIAEFRKAAEKKPADLRALWDWFYLCADAVDNAAPYAAARDLSRATPTDPLALWAYLYIAGRPAARPGQPLLQRTPGRDSRRTARRRWTRTSSITSWPATRPCARAGPSWPQAQILQNVADELKRAKRAEDEERFYREAVAGAHAARRRSPAPSAWPAQRGDVDGL